MHLSKMLQSGGCSSDCYFFGHRQPSCVPGQLTNRVCCGSIGRASFHFRSRRLALLLALGSWHCRPGSGHCLYNATFPGYFFWPSLRNHLATSAIWLGAKIKVPALSRYPMRASFAGLYWNDPWLIQCLNVGQEPSIYISPTGRHDHTLHGLGG